MRKNNQVHKIDTDTYHTKLIFEMLQEDTMLVNEVKKVILLKVN
jgi:hypothetical protein